MPSTDAAGEVMAGLPAPPLPDWLARQLPFRRACLEVEGHRLHWMESGRGLPVVLVHGNPTWGFLWRKVALALAGEPVRLLMPDLVGFGCSDKPRDPGFHRLETHARLLAAWLDALRIERLVLGAQDWGGPIGLLALADRPERAAGLVLLNTAVEPPRPGGRRTTFHRLARWPVVSEVAFRLLGFPLGQLHRVQGDPASLRGEVARAYRWPLARMADRAGPLALARMVPAAAGDPATPGLERCRAFLQGFAGPSALVWGARDPILGRTLARMERLLPGARVTRTQAGHFLQEEVPLEIAAALRDVAARAARREEPVRPVPGP